jgi:hypothetical protein
MVMLNANGSVLAVPHGESDAGTEGIIIPFPLKAVGGGVAHALLLWTSHPSEVSCCHISRAVWVSKVAEFPVAERVKSKTLPAQSDVGGNSITTSCGDLSRG